MRALKDRVSRFLTKISNYRRSLEDICEEDEGMALMNLTSLSKNPSLYRSVRQIISEKIKLLLVDI
jgi:hypothetical protein